MKNLFVYIADLVVYATRLRLHICCRNIFFHLKIDYRSIWGGGGCDFNRQNIDNKEKFHLKVGIDF